MYSFFLYLLIKGYNEDDIYIFTGWFQEEVCKNVKHIKLPKVIFMGKKFDELNSISGIYNNIVGFFKYFYGYFKLRILLFIKTFNCDVEVYGHVQTPFSYMFFEHENSNIIEDGLGNYTDEICETHKINPFIDKFLHICGIYFLNNCECYGTHKNIKNIYLTNENNHPLIKDKVRVIDINELWNNLPSEDQKELLRIFNLDTGKMDFDGKTALILTQPLAESVFINVTEEEEIKIYSDIINRFKDYNVIIKPHPRDEKDFKKIFPNVTILDQSFPVELLDLINIEPTVVCSVISNALLNFENSEIYVYPGELKDETLIKLRKELIELIKKKNRKLIE